MNGNRSRRKGDDYERHVVNYLASIGVPGRRGKRGNETGDILGFPQLVLECKNATKLSLAAWVDQMETEKAVAGAKFGAVIAKRARQRSVGEHYFITTVRDGLLLAHRAGLIEMSPDHAR